MPRKLTLDIFIARALMVHGDKFDYSKVAYVNSETKVIIVCPEHGEFTQRAADHMLGAGCSKCYHGANAIKRALGTEEFIDRAQEVHGNKYDYTLVTYINSSTKVAISCPTHGVFSMRPLDHTHSRQGCPKCYTTTTVRNTEEFISKSNIVHNSKYMYNLTKYTGSKDKVVITCPTHGDFLQAPSGHLSGKGCKACGQELTTFSGKYHNEIPGIVYYVHFPTINMWKIGVTTAGITDRFRNETLPYKVVEVIEFDLVKDAYNLEIEILRVFHKYRYKGPKILRDGSTELLTIDISEYINNRLKEG